MLKPKKRINENAVKKDFFAKKKRSRQMLFLEYEIKQTSFVELIELSNCKLPEENEIIFIRSIRQRPNTHLIPKKAENIYLFASRIQEKFIEDLNISGILIQDKIFEREKEWLQKYNTKKNNNHSKIIAFENQGFFYVISGSGNPSINARNESLNRTI